MTRHTPPSPVQVEEFLPELRGRRRRALRLHPRPGAPDRGQSSVGGPLLWPAEEAWPTCTEEHEATSGEEPPAGTVPLVPIVQLFRRDAPNVSFPEGADLLQVLWCPYDHEPFFGPRPRALWRNSADVHHALDRYPILDDPPEGTVPVPCLVHPEPITEYPGWEDMGHDLYTALWDRAKRMEEQTGWNYEQHLSKAPGIKVGGYPDWVQDAWSMVCDGCEAQMDALLTIASWEYEPGSWRRWLPLEEREGIDEQHGPFSFQDSGSAQGAAGLMLGDVGSVYVFECRGCAGRPNKHGFDCS